MRLASYSPEVSRLRRVAKACAAGELTRTEYREVRRRVLVTMTGEGDSDEQTRPRFLEETTVRRAIPLARTAVANKRQPWLWFLLSCLLMIGLSLPAVSLGQTVPPLAEREAQAKQRYQVESVVWQPTDDTPALEQAEIEQVLQDALHDVQTIDERGRHGFSSSELEEVGRFLNAIGVHDDKTRLTIEDLEDLKALVALQKSKRGLGFAQLDNIAAALQAWVRAQGYPLARAYVPSQDIVDGELRLAVAVGVVSDVLIADSSSGLNETQGQGLTDRLSALVGEPVRRADVETRLNVLNRNPAYSVQAGFQPGDEVGSTELKVHVRREQDWRMRVQIDNHGIEDVGEERLSFSAGRSDVLRAGDRLDLALNTSLASDGQEFGGLSYATHVLERTVHSSLAYADVSVGDGLAADGLLFDTEIVDTRLFTRKKRTELSYLAGWHDVNGQDDAQTAWYLGTEWRGHRLWDQQKISLSHELGIRVGGLSDNDTSADDQFWRLDGELLAWTPFRLPRLASDARFIMRSRWQWTTDQLAATQRFSATSPYTNPGLPVGSLLTDSAIELGVGLRLPHSLGQTNGHWMLGVDTLFGEDNATSTWQHLTTFALGMETDLLKNDAGTLTSALKVGYPLSHKSNGELDDDGAQIFWSLRYAR